MREPSRTAGVPPRRTRAPLLALCFGALSCTEVQGSADGGVDARMPLPDARVPTDATSASDASRGTDGGPHDDAEAIPPEAAIDAADAAPRADAGAREGSCFGRCGPGTASASAGAVCDCDVGCLERGDCCADKHVWCPVDGTRGLCALTGKDVAPGLCGTDLGFSFTHDGKQEIIFGDSYDAHCETLPLLPNDDAQGTLPLALPAALAREESPDCRGVLQLDLAPKGPSFAQIHLYEGSASLSLSYGETPLTAFADGKRVVVVFRRGTSIDAPLYVAARDPSAAADGQNPRVTYRVAGTFDDAHFKNVTAETVAVFDPAQPATHDYRPGTGALFMWGRPDFNGPTAGAVYLLTQPLPLDDGSGKLQLAPRYFAGLVAGQPVFSADKSRAKPVIERDFTRVMQLEVAYVAPLDKWVMLYGGDVADFLDGTPSDQPRRGAIHMRYADHPWGPFSEATPVIFREQLGPSMHCDAPSSAASGGCDLDRLESDPKHSYDPGAWAPTELDFPGCLTDTPVPAQPNLVPGAIVPWPCPGAQRGNLYAPNILGAWTESRMGERGYGHAATLYVNVSTWAPYQVLLTRLHVRLP